MDTKEFKKRRKRLMDMIGSDSIAILPTASVTVRNRDVEFPFRPDSDFFYLTGYPEPEAVLTCTVNDPDVLCLIKKKLSIESGTVIILFPDIVPVNSIILC